MKNKKTLGLTLGLFGLITLFSTSIFPNININNSSNELGNSFDKREEFYDSAHKHLQKNDDFSRITNIKISNNDYKILMVEYDYKPGVGITFDQIYYRVSPWEDNKSFKRTSWLVIDTVNREGRYSFEIDTSLLKDKVDYELQVTTDIQWLDGEYEGIWWKHYNPNTPDVISDIIVDEITSSSVKVTYTHISVEENLNDVEYKLIFPGSLNYGYILATNIFDEGNDRYSFIISKLFQNLEYQLFLRPEIFVKYGSNAFFTTQSGADNNGQITEVIYENLTENSVTIRYGYLLNEGDGKTQYSINNGNIWINLPTITENGIYSFDLIDLNFDTNYLVLIRQTSIPFVIYDINFKTLPSGKARISSWGTRNDINSNYFEIVVGAQYIYGDLTLNLYSKQTPTIKIAESINGTRTSRTFHSFFVSGIDFINKTYIAEVLYNDIVLKTFDTHRYEFNDRNAFVDNIFTEIDASKSKLRLSFDYYLPIWSTNVRAEIKVFNDKDSLVRAESNLISNTTSKISFILEDFEEINSNWKINLIISYSLFDVEVSTISYISKPIETNIIDFSPNNFSTKIIYYIVGGSLSALLIGVGSFLVIKRKRSKQ